HAHSGVAADARAACGTRCEGDPGLFASRPAEDGGGPREVLAPARGSAPPRALAGRARACPREHTLRSARDEERRVVRARTGRGLRSVRQRRLRLGPPRARIDGGRRAPLARLRRTAARTGAEAPRAVARR